MPFLYSLIFALGAAVIAGLCELSNEYDKKPLSAALITGVLSLVVNFVVVYAMMPNFTFWLAGGFPLLLFADGIIVILVTAATSSLANSFFASLLTYAGILVVWLFVAQVFTSPGLVCDNSGYNQMANLMPIVDATEMYPDTNLEELIRVSPQTAMLKAQRAIGGDTNLGSYLAPNEAHLQFVQGNWYYIIDLQVTNWRAFRTKGASVPAYIVVDAMNPQVEAVMRTGYDMKYVPAARFNLDLYRYAYTHKLLEIGRRVDDLTTLEVNDEWQPFYTGTLYRHEVGFKGNVVDGVMTVNPQTGEIEVYDIGETPEWIDRIWSASSVKGYMEWWGSYHDHTACQFEGTAGQRKVDRVNDVITSTGLMFQVTMTSVGADQSLTEVIYVNPKTGDAYKYPLTGATVEAVDNLIDEASRELSSEGYEPVECELQVLLGRQTWYCILNGRGGGENASSGSYAGVAFVQAKHTSDNTNVILSETLADAYSQLTRQIALESRDDPNLANTIQDLVQFSGTVTRKALYTTDDGVTYIYFSLQVQGELFYFQVGGNNPEAAWMQEGDGAVVTAFSIEGNEFLQVEDLVVEGAPNFDN